MTKHWYYLIAVTFLLIVTSLFSCNSSKSTENIEESELFSLKYGSFENELSLFSLNNVGEINTSIAMQEGFFYIANGEAKKIMELNSYGNLLSIFYNKDYNPTPSFADIDSKEQARQSTQRAIQYPFNKIGAITVDSRKYVYITDTLPQERQQNDTERRLHLGQVILRFNEDGEFIDYLGQQGKGGEPFPNVKAIYTNVQNELITVCYTNEGFDVYWFSTEGYMTYTIHVSPANVPNPYKTNDNLDTFISLDNIIPDKNEKKLYIKADYYTSSIDTASNVQSGIDYVATLIHPLNATDGTYEKAITITPFTNTISDGLAKLEYNLPYNFLGVTDSGWLFFIAADDTGYTVQMVQSNGSKVIKRHFDVDKNKTLYYTFSLSNSGIISALFAKRENAIINWWRTDQIIDAMLKS